MEFKYGKLVLTKITFKNVRYFKDRAFFEYDTEYQIETGQEVEKILKENFNFCFIISSEKRIRDEEIDRIIKATMSWLYEKHKNDYDYLACCQAESGLILEINEFYKKSEFEINKNI
ncbi:MAG: hypothetical protein ACP5TO_00935 [Thermoplasmata archaeon]